MSYDSDLTPLSNEVKTRVLNRAADMLEAPGGWTTGGVGNLRSVEGPHCAIGAVAASLYAEAGVSMDPYNDEDWAELSLASVLLPALGYAPDDSMVTISGALFILNDNSATPAPVVKRLRTAAKLAEGTDGD